MKQLCIDTACSSNINKNYACGQMLFKNSIFVINPFIIHMLIYAPLPMSPFPYYKTKMHLISSRQWMCRLYGFDFLIFSFHPSCGFKNILKHFSQHVTWRLPKDYQRSDLQLRLSTTLSHFKRPPCFVRGESKINVSWSNEPMSTFPGQEATGSRETSGQRLSVDRYFVDKYNK